jgi:hypothetical protein
MAVLFLSRLGSRGVIAQTFHKEAPLDFEHGLFRRDRAGGHQHPSVLQPGHAAEQKRGARGHLRVRGHARHRRADEVHGGSYYRITGCNITHATPGDYIEKAVSWRKDAPDGTITKTALPWVDDIADLQQHGSKFSG